METLERKKTHTQLQREQFELDRQSILRLANITEERLATLIFDQGCSFAEQEMSEHFKTLSRSKKIELFNRVLFRKDYWNWWQTEWKTAMNRMFLEVNIEPFQAKEPCTKIGINLFRKTFNEYSKRFINSIELHRSFHNYLERTAW